MEPFPIVVVDGLPEQVTADCGVFVASFAEYFIDGKPIPSSGFDVEIHRDRLAALFYQYDMKKQTENIEILKTQTVSIILTTASIVDATIASAVKAVENLIGSSTHVPDSVETSEKTDLEMVVFQETPILRSQKRDRKKGAVLKSPFIELASGASKSGSSSVSPDDSVYKVVKYVRGLCPLDNKIGEPVDPQLEAEFVTWVDTGLRKHKSNTTTNVYCKGKDTIFPPFRFGVEDINNKMWFHNLAYPNCFLTNSHIDIIFYYLRKKIMYSAEPKIKVTTTDCLFCSSITSLYEKFVEKNNDISVLSLSHNVAQYIQGSLDLWSSKHS
ncbi:uncharacterized protein LOC133036175 [Cannabis sativa]|uniref:uncharacterized protein LOC133036175 n=1 Tax=Cannabis sativa TaxID=3483 RepID=UPI0029CA622F|nr:uncharacterized protein LOC133036175 [Cannabis sativa]